MVLLVGKSTGMGLASREVILARQVSEHVSDKGKLGALLGAHFLTDKPTPTKWH